MAGGHCTIQRAQNALKDVDGVPLHHLEILMALGTPQEQM
jgi:hypothetical protein